MVPKEQEADDRSSGLEARGQWRFKRTDLYGRIEDQKTDARGKHRGGHA